MMRPRTSIVTAAFAIALLLSTMAPLANATNSAQFENPLAVSGSVKGMLDAILWRIILFIAGLTTVISLAALAYGALRLVTGAATSDAEVARAKQIIFWAVIGLAVTGMSVAILRVIRQVLYGSAFIVPPL